MRSTITSSRSGLDGTHCPATTAIGTLISINERGGSQCFGRGLLLGIFAAAVVVAVGVAGFLARPGRPKVVVRFLGYTNALLSDRIGVVEVSNASPFAVVRGRSPVVVSDSPAGSLGFAPTGFRVLAPGEREQILTEPVPNGTRWKMTVTCERLSGDSYGIGPPNLRTRARRVAIWFRDHGVPVREPKPPAAIEFSSDWAEARNRWRP